MKAIVIEPVCPLMTRPQLHCERADEVLAGMVVDLLEEVKPGWYLARAPYRYEGYLQAQHVLTGDHLVRRWTERPKRVVLKGICDVLSGPAVQRIQESALDEVIFLDTIPARPDVNCDKIKYLSVAEMFAEAIERIYEEISVSKLFN